MLKKDWRIRKQKEFDNVFATGVFYSNGVIAVKVVKNNLSISRFAFIVSNKVAKKACSRNRIKRLFREAIRLSLFNIQSGFDVVFIIKRDMSQYNIADITIMTQRLLQKSGLYQINQH